MKSFKYTSLVFVLLIISHVSCFGETTFYKIAVKVDNHESPHVLEKEAGACCSVNHMFGGSSITNKYTVSSNEPYLPSFTQELNLKGLKIVLDYGLIPTGTNEFTVASGINGSVLEMKSVRISVTHISASGGPLGGK